MKKIPLLFAFYILHFTLSSQTIQQKLQKGYQQFESDSQVRHAISSLYVINAKTGEVVFDKNSQVGLAPASTQKIITAATAFELLGKDFKYKTEFWWTKFPDDKSGTEIILIKPGGDPTFGSNRYESSNTKTVFDQLGQQYKKMGLNKDKVLYELYTGKFDDQKIPDGWIWQDIGNYYGAGAAAFNWRENQSDIMLNASPIVGDLVNIQAVDTAVGTGLIDNKLTSGPRNSGDNAYYYFFYGNHYLSLPLLKGTIPAGEKNFKISIAVADPFSYFKIDLLKSHLATAKLSSPNFGMETKSWPQRTIDKLIYTYFSPRLDSVIYWFLQKSINLYGEALIKTLAYEKNGFGATDSGVVIVKDFWKQKGLDPEELNIKDGSGLSPQNRVTTHAQVEILKYAKQRLWFPYFFGALPESNNMKMKSGSISDVKGYCGYQTSGDGTQYIFSFLVNNYSGKSSDLVNKMYKVLDILK